MPPIDPAEIKRRFTSHPMNEDQLVAAEKVRTGAENLALAIVSLTPQGRAQSSALTHLEEASRWAVAAIARREE